MITKYDIGLGKLAVQNGLIDNDQLEELIDELRNGYQRGEEAPTLAELLVERKMVSIMEASALSKAYDRLSRDAEKKKFAVKGYEMIRKIGEGGLGVVYKGRQISMNRLVALKILHKRWQNDEEFRKRFLVEARIVGKLSHQNLIKVFDVGKEGWKYYFSMEFIDGETVEDMIDRDGRLDVVQAIDIIIQVLRAIKYISSHNIVHCDIKPSNIMMSRDGIAKLGDFGFVKTNIEIQPAEEGTVLGTPDYIAPEQAMGHEIDFRSDIYSLGASFYHMLTGHPPYSGSVSTVMEAHIKEEVPHIKKVAPYLPEEVCIIVEKMMAKDPDERYQDFEGIFEELEYCRINIDGDSSGDLMLRSKSTLYNVIKMEKNKARKHLSENIRLEQQLRVFKVMFWSVLAYALVATLYILLQLAG